MLQADFKTEHQGAGISSGGSIGGQFAGNMENALLAGGGNSGHAEGTTQAAVSEGSLIIRDKENQKQDVADLSRDAEHANGSISPIFDKEKEQQRLQEVQLIGEIGSQAADVARTQGEINELNTAREELAKEGVTEPGADASDALKKAYQDALRGTDAYKTTTAKYSTGSDLQRGIQAATAALQGLAGGDIAGAKAGVAGLAGAAVKDMADKMTADELDHLVTLEMMGNDEITCKYLSSLQDKYGSGSASNPNIGKDLTDGEKAELGGAGSGSPGGWEPQDEENARNNEAHSSTNGKNLNSELVGKEIAGGHAFEKHFLQQGEFTGLGIRTRAQFAQHIENVVKNPTSTKELSNGRSAYWDQSTGTVVIRNPKASDGGTAFRPVNGRAYFDNLR